MRFVTPYVAIPRRIENTGVHFRDSRWQVKALFDVARRVAGEVTLAGVEYEVATRSYVPLFVDGTAIEVEGPLIELDLNHPPWRKARANQASYVCGQLAQMLLRAVQYRVCCWSLLDAAAMASEPCPSRCSGCTSGPGAVARLGSPPIRRKPSPASVGAFTRGVDHLPGDRGPIFTLEAVCDNKVEMAARAQAFDSKHPLLAERDRLERILDIMYAKIQKTLFPRNPGRRRRTTASQSNNTGGMERILVGTGVSTDDVLSEALCGLLQYPPERLEGTWEGLAVTIAGNKAIDALRAAGKGLHGTEHRNLLHLVSGDLQREGPDGEMEPALFESLPSNWGDPEAEYFVLQDALKVRDLAREALSDRDRKIFFAIHFDGDSRKEVGERLGLTSQRIGQIYNAALRTLEAHPDYPFKPPITIERLVTRRNR